MHTRRLAAFVFVSFVTSLIAGPMAAADLTVSKVVLYKHGIGFFERNGMVPAGDNAQLQFKATEMDDVLKSLTVEQRGGTGVSAVRYDSSDPLAKRLEIFPFRIGPRVTLADILDQFKGAQIELRLTRGRVSGTIISARHSAATDRQAERLEVMLLMEDGETPDQVAAHARAAADEGFTAVKFDPLPDGYQNMTHARQISSVRDQVAAAREAVGDDVDLILEIHRKLTPLVAVPLAEAVAEFRPLFYEDPIQIDSIMSQAEVARRISIPVANGERLHSIWEFRELLVCGGPQYVRPDVGLAGGLTHCKKIAAIAESFHSAVVTHNFLGPVLTAASVHLDTCIPNFVTQEYTKDDESPANAVYRTNLKRAGGFLPVPDAPGLGIDLDDAVLARAQAQASAGLEPPSREPLLCSDGSVAFRV